LPLSNFSNKSKYFDENLFDNLGYIDPNLFIKETDEIDKSMDIYSLGSLLWEIMSERVPYLEDKKDGILQLVNKIINNDYREKDIDDVPSKYMDLYKRCWNRNSLERPPINDVYHSLLNIKKGM